MKTMALILGLAIFLPCMSDARGLSSGLINKGPSYRQRFVKAFRGWQTNKHRARHKGIQRKKNWKVRFSNAKSILGQKELSFGDVRTLVKARRAWNDRSAVEKALIKDLGLSKKDAKKVSGDEFYQEIGRGHVWSPMPVLKDILGEKTLSNYKLGFWGPDKAKNIARLGSPYNRSMQALKVLGSKYDPHIAKKLLEADVTTPKSERPFKQMEHELMVQAYSY